MFTKTKKSRKSRKAQIGATLTWIVAFLIIFFIMVLFILAAGGVSKIREIKGWFLFKSPEGIDVESRDLVLTNNLISVLNTPVDSNGKKTIEQSILETLDVYIDNEAIMNALGGDINNLNQLAKQRAITGLNKVVLSQELLVAAGYKEEQEKEILRQIEITLDKICDGYIFEIPNMRIYKYQGKGISSISKEILENEFVQELTLKIPYNSQIIEIKYRQLKKC